MSPKYLFIFPHPSFHVFNYFVNPFKIPWSIIIIFSFHAPQLSCLIFHSRLAIPYFPLNLIIHSTSAPLQLNVNCRKHISIMTGLTLNSRLLNWSWPLMLPGNDTTFFYYKKSSQTSKILSHTHSQLKILLSISLGK